MSHSETESPPPCPPRFSLVLSSGPPDDPKSVQNWSLARTLAERGHAVELVCDGGRHDLAGVHEGFTVSTWPSPVPGRPRDFLSLAVNGTPLTSLGGGRWSYGLLTLSEIWTSTSMSLSVTGPAPVPEIDPASLSSVLALLAGSLGLVERRRAARRGRPAGAAG